MHRRDVITGIAASGLASVAVGTAAGARTTDIGGVAAADLDAVHVTRDGNVVGTVENPTEADLDRLFAALGDDEGLVTPDKCCLYECQTQCAFCDYPPGCTDDCCCGYMDPNC